MDGAFNRCFYSERVRCRLSWERTGHATIIRIRNRPPPLFRGPCKSSLGGPTPSRWSIFTRLLPEWVADSKASLSSRVHQMDEKKTLGEVAMLPKSLSSVYLIWKKIKTRRRKLWIAETLEALQGHINGICGFQKDFLVGSTRYLKLCNPGPSQLDQKHSGERALPGTGGDVGPRP